MEPMFVTLEVSKLLSGWLNFTARCRVEGRGHKNAVRMRCGARCGPGGGRAWSGVGASGAQSGAV